MNDEEECTELLNDYMLFCFDSQHAVKGRENLQVDKFTDWWSGQVAAKLKLNKEDILSIYGPNDELQTKKSLNDLFWYGDGLRIQRTPTLFINGVLQ